MDGLDVAREHVARVVDSAGVVDGLEVVRRAVDRGHPVALEPAAGNTGRWPTSACSPDRLRLPTRSSVRSGSPAARAEPGSPRATGSCQHPAGRLSPAGPTTARHRPVRRPVRSAAMPMPPFGGCRPRLIRTRTSTPRPSSARSFGSLAANASFPWWATKWRGRGSNELATTQSL